MFSCSVDRTLPPSEAVEKDAWQLSVDWIPLQDVPALRFFPAALVPHLVDLAENEGGSPRYLGDVN